MRAAEAKIAPLARVRERVDEVRRAGRTVAVAVGSFDVLHVGHVRYLRAARREAELLVVVVDGDDAVRRAEGEGRPVQPALDRALLIAALEAVDHVVVGGPEDARALVDALRPDVLCLDAGERSREDFDGCGARVAVVGDAGHDGRAFLSRIGA